MKRSEEFNFGVQKLSQKTFILGYETFSSFPVFVFRGFWPIFSTLLNLKIFWKLSLFHNEGNYETSLKHRLVIRGTNTCNAILQYKP
jgi:hypothetical protein